VKPGTQIAYIPAHALGDIYHPDVEFGFVTSQVIVNRSHFCRFWLKGQPGRLRTVSNSEMTPDECLVEAMSVHQSVVRACLERIRKEGD